MLRHSTFKAPKTLRKVGRASGVERMELRFSQELRPELPTRGDIGCCSETQDARIIQGTRFQSDSSISISLGLEGLKVPKARVPMQSKSSGPSSLFQVPSRSFYPWFLQGQQNVKVLEFQGLQGSVWKSENCRVLSCSKVIK